MNRNYLPPALKMNNNNSSCLSQSPPISSGGHSYNSTYSSTSTISSPHPSLGSSGIYNPSTLSLPLAVSAPSAATSYTNRRLYGKACKLPPVQEVGKFSALVILTIFRFN